VSFAIVAYIDLSKEKQSVTESGRYHRVVAFGCSHVVGCEIQPYLGGEIWDYDQHCKPWAFPQELAQKLQMPCSNLAGLGQIAGSFGGLIRARGPLEIPTVIYR
jgi:hypothetical protein